MSILDSTILTFEFGVTEEQLRDRLVDEAVRALGLMNDEGERAPGISTKVLRGDGRAGGYRVRITRDMSKATEKRLPAPAATENSGWGA